MRRDEDDGEIRIAVEFDADGGARLDDRAIEIGLLRRGGSPFHGRATLRLLEALEQAPRVGNAARIVLVLEVQVHVRAGREAWPQLIGPRVEQSLVVARAP